MNRFERMKSAITRKRLPDKVPHGDCMIWPQLHDKILGGNTFKDYSKINYLAYWMSEEFDEDFFIRDKKTKEFLNFDWVHIFPTEKWKLINDLDSEIKIKEDPFGVLWKISSDSFNMYKSPINKIDDLRNYELPSLNDFSFNNLNKWKLNSDFFKFVQIDSGIFKLYQIMGFDKFMISVMDNKNELVKFNEKLSIFQLDLAKAAIRNGADCIWLSDDHSGLESTFLSPELMWEIDFRFQQNIVREIHKLGIPCIMHSCGNLNKTIELMINTEIDAIMGIQPTAHNNIFDYKKKYGDRISFIGNICVSNLMPKAKPYEIDEEVKKLIEYVGANGGLIVSTCNALLDDQPVENVITLHLSVEKYGHYYK